MVNKLRSHCEQSRPPGIAYRPKAIFLLLFSLFFSFPLFPAKTTLINGTAASVGKDLITVQDAYVYRALQRFKSKEYPAVQIETGENLKRTVQKAAFEHMVYLELKSFEFEGGAKSSGDKELQDLKRQKPKEWESISSKFNVSDKELTDKYQRSVQVERFMQKKVDTLTPIITDAEAEKFFKENPGRFKGSQFEQMKNNIQVLLKKQHIQKGLAEWIQFLKEKYGFAILLEG